MSGRRGVALVSVLLLLLIATGLAHGVLLLARAERTSAIARVRAWQADAAALAGLDESLRDGSWSELSGTPVWAVRVVGVGATHDGTVSARRLGPESWWLEYGTDGPGTRRIGVPGRLAWWMDPVTRIESLGAVVSVGAGVPWSLAGTVDRSMFARIPVGLDAASCGMGSGWSGDPPDLLRTLTDTASRQGLGLLPLDTILARTEVVLDRGGTMEPMEESERCVADDPWNWGDPEALHSPCGQMVAVRAARSDLRVEGGVGQAAVVVDGDLELAGTSRLYGFVLTTGVLRVLDEAELHGAALALGGVVVEGGARVQGGACWAARALHSARAEWMPNPLRVPLLSNVGP